MEASTVDAFDLVVTDGQQRAKVALALTANHLVYEGALHTGTMDLK